MALVDLASSRIPILPGFGTEGYSISTRVQTTMDAAGESTAYIGQLQWEDGGSHTVSSAGGKIHWMPPVSATFANAGTTIRIGIQDVVLTTGIEDGSFDVYKDLVGGTDPIAGAAPIATAMANGTKTIANNDIIAVVIEMTSRGGADAVAPGRVSSLGTLPYCTVDTGSGPGKNASAPLCMVEADDGALGIFYAAITIPCGISTTSFNNGSAIDEYAIVFEVPVKCVIDALCGFIGEIDSGETGNLLLYTDPTGTPTLQRTASIDPDVIGQVAAAVTGIIVPITEYTLEVGTLYAISYQATSAGNRSISRLTTHTNANLRKFSFFGTTLLGGSRADNTGAFSTTSDNWPNLGFLIKELDDGSGGGGGLNLYAIE